MKLTAHYLDKIELDMTKFITEDLSDKLVYNNIGSNHRMSTTIKELADIEGISDLDREILLAACWLRYFGFKDLDKFDLNSYEDLYINCNECTLIYAKDYLNSIGYPKDRTEQILQILSESNQYFRDSNIELKNPLTKIFLDASNKDWARKNGRKYMKQLYQQFLLTGVAPKGKSNWHDTVLKFLINHEYLTTYGKEKLESKKQTLIKKIEKEKKENLKNQQLILKKELDISDDELKKLKKSLKSVKGRDERGIQTMFRTTSRNHYTLNQMVDRKANIMISVNAIILSLIISRIVGQIQTFCVHNSPIIILLLVCTISIILAIVAIIPSKSHGEFTEEDIRNKEGNLLYFGNYYNMSFRDYNWGMLQLLNDGDHLYTTMIRDQYFLGQMLNRKYTYIRKSLFVFMFGFAFAVLIFVIVSTLPGFHIGGVHDI